MDEDTFGGWLDAVFEADAADLGTGDHQALAGVAVELVALVEVPVEDGGLAFLLGLATHLLTYDDPSHDAERWLRTAIEIEPAWAEPRIQLGCLLSQRGDWPAVRDIVAPLGPDDIERLVSWRATTLLGLRSASALAIDPAHAADDLRAHIAYLDQIGDAASECPWPSEVLHVLHPLRPGELASPEVDDLIRALVERIAAASPGGRDDDRFATVLATWSPEGAGLEATS